MSMYAATEIGGESIDAWEYRELYLTYGTRFDDFFCPFCDIPLVAMLVYCDEELSRSPHFAARGVKHRFDCNGEPQEIDPPDRKPPRAHYKPRRMGVPEALCERPVHREYTPPRGGPKKLIVPPTEADVKARRRKAGSLGRPIPKTHLIQSIVEARSIELTEIYDRASKEEWTTEKRNAEIKKVMSGMPLRLEDVTTYDDAFRGPTFLHWKFRRIYNGKGLVVHRADGLIIESKTDGRLKGEPVPFLIQIDPSAVTSASPRSHAALLEKLEAFANDRTEVRWYAYGKPDVQSGTVVVPIQNFDHIYVKKGFVAKPSSPPGPSEAGNHQSRREDGGS